MATGNILPSELTVVGIGKQTTVGTGVAATSYIRTTSLTPQPNVPYLPDNSFQGDMAGTHDLVQGPISSSFELNSNLYADEIGWPLASLLGDLTVSGASDPYTTAFSLLNTPPGQTKRYTLLDWNGATSRQFIDATCNELALTLTDEALVTVNSKWDAIALGSTTQPTQSYPGTLALPAWKAVISINSLVGTIVLDCSLDLKRTNVPIPGMESTSSQTVAAIFNAADLKYTGSATLVYDSTQGPVVEGYFLNGTVVPLIIDLNTTEATFAHEVKLTSTATVITGATLTRDSATYVKLAITFEGKANTTDVGTSAGKAPVKATTKAGNVSGTYA